VSRSETIDKLKDANKKLRAKNRQLRKEMKTLKEDMDLLQSIWQSEIKEIREFRRERKRQLEESRLPACPQCGNPTLERKQAGKWMLESCLSCNHFERSPIYEDQF